MQRGPPREHQSLLARAGRGTPSPLHTPPVENAAASRHSGRPGRTWRS